MRIELVERLITVLTGLSLLLIAVTVIALRGDTPWRSGIPEEATAAAGEVAAWLDAQRAARDGRRREGAPWIAPAPVTPQPATSAAQGRTGTPEYFVADERPLPPGDAIPGHRWLRRVPGVAYAQPRAIPRLVWRRYQSYEEAWELAQSGGGAFVRTEQGDDAWRIAWLDPTSLLAARLGLQPGDEVLSVNGLPLGASAQSGRALYEQLRDETRFAVLVRRGGQQVVLSFFVRE